MAKCIHVIHQDDQLQPPVEETCEHIHLPTFLPIHWPYSRDCALMLVEQTASPSCQMQPGVKK